MIRIGVYSDMAAQSDCNNSCVLKYVALDQYDCDVDKVRYLVSLPPGEYEIQACEFNSSQAWEKFSQGCQMK